MASTCAKHLQKLCRTRQFDAALATACSMDQQNIPISREIIYSLLQGHKSKKEISSTKKIHALMIRNKLDHIPVLADHLIRLFITCGSLDEAQLVFSSVSKPSLYTWNAILTAHSKLGSVDVAFFLYGCMHQGGFKPDKITILCMLKVCGMHGDPEKGRLIHNQIFNDDLRLDMSLASTLVDMYAKCNSLEDARNIFDELPSRDVVAWGAMLAGYAQHGNGVAAMQLFEAMQVEGVKSNEIVYSSVLKACGASEAIEEGQLLHGQVIEAGLDSDLVVGSSMVDMYSKFRRLDDAQKLFRNFSRRDSILWGTMVAGYTLCGEEQLALVTFNEMLQEDVTPCKPMLLCVLKAASTLIGSPQGRLLHDLLIRTGLEVDLMLANALIDMYARCMLLDEASRVFDRLKKRDVVSWAGLMAGYAEYNDCESIIGLCLEMQKNGISPDRVVILFTLKACAGSANIGQGRAIHKHICKSGFELDVVLSNALIDMYSKCGCLEEARFVFDETRDRDAVSWGAMIAVYANSGDGRGALKLLKQMLDEGVEVGKVVLLCSIKACGSARAIAEGRFLHDRVIESGLEVDLEVGSTLVNTYAKCSCLEDATSVFNELPSCDLVAWTSMILSYAEQGDHDFVVELFEKMQAEGIDFNEPILLCIVKTCGGVCDLTQGRLLHYQVVKCGLESSAPVANLLINMYAKFQSLGEACQIFDRLQHRDEMSWGTIVAAFLHDGLDFLPLDLCRDYQGLAFGNEMLICVLKACSNTGFLKQGRVLHFLAVESGGEEDILIGNTLVHMYAKCDELHDAFTVFDRLPRHDLVTYSTIIARLMEADLHFPAFQFYIKLQHEGLKTDMYICKCMLKVCGTLNLIGHGRHVHSQIVKDELDSDAGVRSALVDMYSNCASLKEAERLIGKESEPDRDIWGAIIAGYTPHGDCDGALRCLEDMKKQGMDPTVRMFSSTLAACSHAGALDKGHRCFEAMTGAYKVVPTVEHLNCMLDLFGRAGHLQLAADFLTAMPTCLDIVGWRSLLSGSLKYGSIELGDRCFDRAVCAEPDDVCRTDAWPPIILSGAYQQARLGLPEMSTSMGNANAYKALDPNNDLVSEMVRSRARNNTKDKTARCHVCVESLLDEGKHGVWLPCDEKINVIYSSQSSQEEKCHLG